MAFMICKYYTPRMKTLKALCKCLYDLDGCGAGGMLHIVLDDDNIDNHSIEFCMNECKANPEKEESKLGILICEELLRLSMEERILFSWMWSGRNPICLKAGISCDNCELIHDFRYEDD